MARFLYGRRDGTFLSVAVGTSAINKQIICLDGDGSLRTSRLNVFSWS